MERPSTDVDKLTALRTAIDACMYPASKGRLWDSYAAVAMLEAMYDLTGADDVDQMRCDIENTLHVEVAVEGDPRREAPYQGWPF